MIYDVCRRLRSTKSRQPWQVAASPARWSRRSHASGGDNGGGRRGLEKGCLLWENLREYPQKIWPYMVQYLKNFRIENLESHDFWGCFG